MIGVQDFIGYYDWTFEYLRRNHGGDAAVERYWAEAIAFNSQNHANILIQTKGLEGMKEYWGETLESEEAGYRTLLAPDYFRIDMYDCPSKGYLIRHNQAYYHDYCQHCMGWIKPIMDRAGFVIDHEHNHQGQCWWEMRRASEQDEAPTPPPIRDEHDVRLLPHWQQDEIDRWLGSRRQDE